MDLTSVRGYRVAAGRADLALAAGETLLAGGTWLLSEPQPGTTGLVDLTALGWTPCEPGPDGGLRIAATCTVTELLAHLAGRTDLGSLTAAAHAAAAALVMSWKVQHTATVGGNVALALPAGALTSWLAGLGATALVWTPGGGERREPVASLVTGVRRTTLAPGEVLRAVDVPVGSCRARTAFRRASLATHGRSGAVVTGRATGAGPALVVTAATTRPVVLVPGADPLAQLAQVDCWYDDPHGAPDWRRAMTHRLVGEVVRELAG